MYDRYNIKRHTRGNQSGIPVSERVSANVKLKLRNMATFEGRTGGNRHLVTHKDGFEIKFFGNGNIEK